MSADKKITRNDLPRPEKTDVRHQHQEEYDAKPKEPKAAKETKESVEAANRGNTKKRRVNYVIKDLPIY